MQYKSDETKSIVESFRNKMETNHNDEYRCYNQIINNGF